MKKNFIILFAVLPLLCSAQKQGNIWYFGNHAGLDFNNNPPTALLSGQTYFPSPNSWNEGCSSMSDSSGSLLFYTNGLKVWNKNQQIMPHGDTLMGHASSTQSSIIVPQPGSSRYFYVFTTDAEENNFTNGLRYSLVDMCLDNGNGDIVSIAKNIKMVDTTSEKLISVKHANGIDYWIITHKFNSDAFYSFLLTSSGITNTIISHTGTIDLQGWGGQMKNSPNANKIAYAIPNGLTSTGKTLLLDFSNSSGTLTNEQILSSGGREWGVSFSPDNSKLYFSTYGFSSLFQYNLNAGNLAAIIASKTYIVTSAPDGMRDQQLGPDGKIYLSRTGKQYLSIINYPDSTFPACGYIDSAVYLGGKKASFGLPNFINSYDYSNTVYTCPVNVKELNKNLVINIYPNPTSDLLLIEITNNQEQKEINLVDVIGNVLQRQNAQVEKIGFDVSNLNSGIYFIKIKTQEGLLIKKIIVQH